MPQAEIQAGLGEGDHYVTLANIGGGAACELFAETLRKVLENVADINTDPQAVREITLKFKIKPNEDRNLGAVEIIPAAKLAPPTQFRTVFFMGRHHNRYVAVESDPKQRGLFEEKPAITPLSGGKAGQE